jgi:hypothetical protein
MDRGTHWHIAMDDRLFDLPVAALVAGMDADGAAYVIERQSFDFVPGAWALGSRTFAGAPRRFVGIGDGIYNTADPRYPASAAGTAPWFRLLPTVLAGDGSPLQLPRLAGSSAEVAAAAAESGADAVLLTGTRVSRKRIMTLCPRYRSTSISPRIFWWNARGLELLRWCSGWLRTSTGGRN